MYWDRGNSPDGDELREQLREAIERKNESRAAANKVCFFIILLNHGF